MSVNGIDPDGIDPDSGEPEPIARLSLLARVKTASHQGRCNPGRSAADGSFSVRNQLAQQTNLPNYVWV